MADVFFDNPPVLTGDESTQLRQLYGYLGTISNKLNEALMNITIEQMAPETQEEIRTAASGTKEQRQSENTLKSLIIKSAEIVRTEMQELSTRLEAETQAISAEFGDLQQNLSNTIRATAEGVLQDYHYDETVTNAQTGAAYKTHTEQYIYTGLLNTNPVEYGIAIGENVTNTDGTLNTSGRMATFTMTEMAFWQGETKVAYFSNGRFRITNGEIINTLQIGNYIWKRLTDGGIGLILSTQ
jgi:hypothetical protein